VAIYHCWKLIFFLKKEYRPSIGEKYRLEQIKQERSQIIIYICLNQILSLELLPCLGSFREFFVCVDHGVTVLWLTDTLPEQLSHPVGAEVMNQYWGMKNRTRLTTWWTTRWTSAVGGGWKLSLSPLSSGSSPTENFCSIYLCDAVSIYGDHQVAWAL
jgi:hypothetical protein